MAAPTHTVMAAPSCTRFTSRLFFPTYIFHTGCFCPAHVAQTTSNSYSYCKAQINPPHTHPTAELRTTQQRNVLNAHKFSLLLMYILPLCRRTAQLRHPLFPLPTFSWWLPLHNLSRNVLLSCEVQSPRNPRWLPRFFSSLLFLVQRLERFIRSLSLFYQGHREAANQKSARELDYTYIRSPCLLV